ncbi:Kinesin [Macleaya cordata]|uniref:Kinesin n=1 Tax=Macleaya cordata TaxID=56857 RepID=A0A200PNH9_MACCD|nr:Kinesin [Macleaya cordata]
MEETNQPKASLDHNLETLNTDSCFSRVYDWDEDLQENPTTFLNQYRSPRLCNKNSSKDGEDAGSLDSILCISGSRLVPSGFSQINCTVEDVVMFVNAGGGALNEGESSMKFEPDSCFQGGQSLRTDESIINGGDFPSIYQSARSGNFCYKFENLPPGDYFVDLHFVEILFTNGPKGMRVFNVFLQGEKVLSELDIYSIVGANKPLQLLDARVAIGDDGAIVLSFDGVNGSPVVSGICIRRASKLSVPPMKPEYLICNNCATEIEVPPDQKKLVRSKSMAKYEKKIQELTSQCQLKTNECYEAWMSLTAANEQLEKVRMELDDKMFQAHALDQTMENQAAKLKDVSCRYERDKKFWIAAVNDLEGKIKAMKKEQLQLSREAHECADSIPELKEMVCAVQALVAQCEDLKGKYMEEQAKRKKLYNQVQEAKGMVFCRCRPLSKGEVSAGYSTVVDFDAAKDGDLGVLTGGSTKKTFKFDRVYTPKDDQVDVFVDASPMVVSVLDGYNVCIFAYGQTGTGKTFTMEGPEHNRGVNYRTLKELFNIARQRSDTFTYNISVSVLEVYNEQIRDLLATSPTTKKLEIRQASEGVHHVPGIVEANVENIKEVWDVLQAGSNARVVGSNNVNEHSSRSHCMLCIMVRAKNLMTGECTKSKLWLVDLAGSERLAKTDVQGERLKEAQNINRSLSALGDVISALANKSSHIPYRNSKLTHLLQDSLGGDSKTLMFVQISPSEYDLGETLSSLNFATRVRGIELGPAKKQIDTGELQKLKMMLDKARQESKSKDESLRKLEENIQNLEAKARTKDQLCKNQQEKVKELEGQLDSKMEVHNQWEQQVWQLNEKLKGREETCIGLQHKVAIQMNNLSFSFSLDNQQYFDVSSLLIYLFKVKELENKVKEREQLESLAYQQKVKELENRLREREQNLESSILHQKVKELEDKLREREQQIELTLQQSHSAKMFRSTPSEGKIRSGEEYVSENDPQILRSMNSINRATNQESVLLRGTDPLREIRRKREIRSGEIDNSFGPSTSLLEKKIMPTELKKARQLPAELEKARQIDPSKAFARLTRTTKTVTAHRLSSHNRVNKDPVVAIKERDKTRGWSR